MLSIPPSETPLKLAAKPFPARVVRVTHAGLVVALPNGREGLVREREIAWNEEERKAERYRPGDVVTVVPLGKGSERRPELSIRLARFDPWGGVKERYPPGLLVDGVVTGVMPYGVFVELEPGVTGLVHVSRFPTWVHRPPGEIFWPGDLVKVIIETVDVQRRRIGLSMADLLTRRWQGERPARKPLHVSTDQPALGTGARLTLDALFRLGKRTHVLVVEDDDAQRQSLVNWLRDTGQWADGAPSAETALAMIPGLPLDLVLIDVGLPGMDGIEAARQIGARWPALRCALMTDWSRAERWAKEIEPLRAAGVALLIKPLLPEDLLAVLLDGPVGLTGEPPSVSPARLRLEQARPTWNGTGGADLGVVLARLLVATRADKAVLFELESEGRRITVVEQRGAAPLHLAALPELIHSPVRDVAEEERVVVAATPAEAFSQRFLHLTPLLNFAACVGVPVPALLASRFALFLFFAHPLAAAEHVLAKAEAAATAVGSWLERRHLIRQTADLNRMVVMGQMTRALVHEISGRLAPINLTLQRLQTACDAVEGCVAADPAQALEVVRQARQELQALAQQVETLARTVRSFGRMARPDEVEIVRLDEIVAEAIDILSDTAQTAHVTLALQPVPHLFFTRTRVTHLQQVIVNVVQNAIQQIHLLRPQVGGRVEIRLGQAIRHGEPVLQVTVEDDGPGIHRRLWERIFDMDYTTRPDGSGLGLYLSRSLIEAQGGRVYVADSRIGWGSVFVVELPYRT
ncbi:MAG: S1 RNA-binding domain-containing protein [Anaerolineae bacterium]|nr:S1 RNA-binding domain-containing protein [Anaerolineae bacterium]